MWYNIDFFKWAVSILPPHLRKPKMVGFIKVLISQIEDLHYEFLKRRAIDEFIFNHNGQVCYLRKALNDLFDRDLRRIRIGDGNLFDRQYIYTRSERKTVYLGKFFTRDKSDYADTGVDYIVYVPTGILTSRRIEIENWIEVFNEATIIYKIIGE